MIRRLVGIAHNADFERIEDPDVKATCEKRALRVGREILVNCDRYETIEDVLTLAKQERSDGLEPCFPMAPATPEG
jgi:5-methylthioribose kinase